MVVARYQTQYRLSVLGRIAYLILFCMGLLGVAAVVVPGLFLALTTKWWPGVGVMLFAAAGFVGLMLVSGLRAFAPGLRITLSEEGFKYVGFFRVERVRWSEVASYRLAKGDLFMSIRVRLKPEARTGARTVTLDVGNLSPPAIEVVEGFEEGTGLKPEIKGKKK
jgi:hypothetical protein